MREILRRLFILGLGIPFSSSVYAGAYFLEYTVYGAKVKREWHSPVQIRWRYNPTGAPTDAQNLIAAAFDQWKQNSDSNIEIEYAGTISSSSPANDGYCDIFFNYDFTNLGANGQGIIALTLRNGSVNDILRNSDDRFLVDGDILINPEFSSSWVTDENLVTSSSVLDVREVVTHEIGHLLGLAHSFSIDAIMYPAKPQSSTPADMKALVRFPKRTLAQDDKAWIGSLYPSSSFDENTAAIQGRVFYNGQSYVGALVTAVKTDESDVSLNYTAAYPSDLILRGMSNVSTFSEQDGRFEMKGLKPGNYKILVQDGSGFLSFSLGNVNEYLSMTASTSVMPMSMVSNPDCALSSSALTSTSVQSAYDTAASYSIGAGEVLCGVEILAKTGGSSCKGEFSVHGDCGGGGCTLQPEIMTPEPTDTPWVMNFIMDYKGVFIMLIGSLIILWSVKTQLNANTKKPTRKDLR